jgi:4-amino-4-deoxy-L-arabinose transferase-like glycosyltransferase
MTLRSAAKFSAGRDALWLAALLSQLVAASMARPLLPIDETRYAAVAWEMWTRGDFLVPHLNGMPYHHKPPLLFWLTHAGWAVFGVNEWWPRLISPLFAGGTLALTYRLGRELWPAKPEVARMAPFILLASLLFAYFAAALMFDAMLAFFVALGVLGVVRAWRAGGFMLLTLGMGGALFAKGPVALLHLLPLALFAPWWMREQRPAWGRWYAGVALSLLGAAALILAWAVPAGLAGGEAYRNAILWGQTANRMVESFAHRAPWWFYLAWLPLMLAPWLLWPRWWGLGQDWRALSAVLGHDSGVRLALFGALFCLVFFSFVSGKRVHYLLPEFALFALLAARALVASPAGRWSLVAPAATLMLIGAGVTVAAPWLDTRLGGAVAAPWLQGGGVLALVAGLVLATRRPAGALSDVRRVATATVVAAFGVLVGFDGAMREPYDLDAVAHRLAQYEREGRPVAIEGKYHGQWSLAGRLQQALIEVPEPEIAAWLAAHPEGRALIVYRQPAEIPAGVRVEYTRRYRGAWLAIVAAARPEL